MTIPSTDSAWEIAADRPAYEAAFDAVMAWIETSDGEPHPRLTADMTVNIARLAALAALFMSTHEVSRR